MSFASLLLDWYRRGHRDLPWRRTGDPYRIWVSEIMLQQTRVATVIPYYERFLARFPDVLSLAAAAEQDLLSAWAGLGYYSRVRNMQRAAQSMNGVFPRTWEEIRALAGIGDYTAAAVGSIAFGLPHAAVDGNVLRVLSRVTNESGDIGSARVKDRLRATADALLQRNDPGQYNQALMELGATVCVPRAPLCLTCPVAELCEGRKAGRQNELPVKVPKATTVRRTRRVFVVENDSALLLWQRQNRSEKLLGFWELPEAEHFQRPPLRGKITGQFRHSITNHQYTFEVVLLRAPRKDLPQLRADLPGGWIRKADLTSIVLSTTARKALSRSSVLTP